MNLSRNTILLIVSAVVVLGGGAYYFLFFKSDTGPALQATGPSEASDAELSFITLVSKLDPIVFDTRLISDTRFTSRQDIKTTILPETSGRKDPFAPLGR